MSKVYRYILIYPLPIIVKGIALSAENNKILFFKFRIECIIRISWKCKRRGQRRNAVLDRCVKLQNYKMNGKRVCNVIIINIICTNDISNKRIIEIDKCFAF